MLYKFETQWLVSPSSGFEGSRRDLCESNALIRSTVSRHIQQLGTTATSDVSLTTDENKEGRVIRRFIK